MIRRISTIDAHAAGEPLRLVTAGFPRIDGRTMLEKRERVRAKHDRLRRALMLEPRGHADMYGAILTEPVTPDADAGVLFMHNEGYSTMCGHGVIAVVTIALERGLLTTSRNEIVLDTPAGQVRARAKLREPRAEAAGRRTTGEVRLKPDATAKVRLKSDTTAKVRLKPDATAKVRLRPDATAKVRLKPDTTSDGAEGGGTTAGVASGFSRTSRVESVAFVNVPSFVFAAGLPIKAAGRDLRVDVAFGGAFYAIVDSEATGIPIQASRLPDLRRVGMEIKHAVEKTQRVAHPLEPGLEGIYGTIFIGPAGPGGTDLRNVTIFADAEVDRSPCGTGTCAVMAVLDAMGLLPQDHAFRHESIIGTTFNGRIVGRTEVEQFQAIVPEIEGSAFITGEHTFILDDDDPLKNGFRL